jgi:glucokinase
VAEFASSAHRLVADIGGTNTRLALYDPAADELRSLRTYINRDYGRFDDVIAAWLQDLPEPQPSAACLAIAAPPFGDQVSMLNIDWSFSLSGLARRFGFTRLRGINDFEGNAYALPHLGDRDLSMLHAGQPGDSTTLATVGPGTGLGGATLRRGEGNAVACASEPGHMGLSPATPLELELFRSLQPRYGEVYAELLVSGPGLLRLYNALASITGEEASPLSPEDISARAQAGQCELCSQTLNTFCALLGSVCGDFVLANGAYGGLYLAGGFLPRMIGFLKASPFMSRFRMKGKMTPHLSRVPLQVITSETLGLRGAAHAPLE